MPSLPSSSDAYEQLHPEVRRWIWQQGWDELRPVQRAAIPPIVAGEQDVIIAAQTAAGKTEAAFLPLISRIADEPAGGFRLLYVSPLKALINDQFRRLDALCEALEVPVFRWHGDVSAAHKKKARRSPAGILLITPESLEATFILRGLEIARLFGALDAVVIDELHAFIGTDRGRQLQSLLHRLEVAIDRRVTRIGLSATLGDMTLAADFLRPGQLERVRLVDEPGTGQDLRLQLRGFVRGGDAATEAGNGNADTNEATGAKEADEPDGEQAVDPDLAVQRAMATALYRHLRGGRHLVFAGRRSTVEEIADLLRQLSEHDGVPNEFFPHHSNLSRSHREFVEARLREGNQPISAVCTATLELGIDIGDIATVAQIGPPWSVASLRQRLGRSGRRAGSPASLRLYVAEAAVRHDLPPPDALRCDLVQAIAMIGLMLEKWVEPPRPTVIDLSTLTHQTLSLIAERGGIQARRAWEILCRDGPFAHIPANLYLGLLRTIGRPEAALIEQAGDGTLLLGPAGERLVDHYEFYSVFCSGEEYRVIHNGTTLGTLPVVVPLAEGMTVIFSGRRWSITAVFPRENLIEVEPSTSGRPPVFGGTGGDLHDVVVDRMRRLYLGNEVPSYLDPVARTLVAEARTSFFRLGLDGSAMIEDDGQVWLFPWLGTVKLGTLALTLRARGIEADVRGIALEIGKSEPESIAAALADIAARPPPDPLELANIAASRNVGKYDGYLTDDLLLHSFASQRLDVGKIGNARYA